MESDLKSEKGLIKELSNLVLAQIKREKDTDRNEKIKKLLLILGAGAGLMVALTMPGTTRLFKDFLLKDSDWDEWKHFNKEYHEFRTLQPFKVN